MADCPACGKPYTVHVMVKSGERFRSVFPAPPYTTFKKYARVCVNPEGLKRAQGTTHLDIGIYFHTLQNLFDDGPGFAP